MVNLQEILAANFITVFSAVVGVVIWLIRLEGKVKHTADDLNEFKETIELRDLKTDARFERNGGKFEKTLERIEKQNETLQEIKAELKDRLGKVESDLAWIKKNWSK